MRIAKNLLALTAVLILVGGVLFLWRGASLQAIGSQTTPRVPGTQLGKISNCVGENAEVEQAVDPANGYIYEAWMGCSDTDDNAIGFTRSTDGGHHFSKPLVLSRSLGSDDPALAVAPDGTVYVTFMQDDDHHTFPVVETSFDHGSTFKQVRALVPPGTDNYGDRGFIAVGPDGTAYLTWVYGPNAKLVKERCFDNGGSCTVFAGNVNTVIQVSTDHGRTWGPMIPLNPGYPSAGTTARPVVEPNGRIDVEYQAYDLLNAKDYKFGSGHSYFTSSMDKGKTWSKPVLIGPAGLTMSVNVWWIDGDIGIDRAGNLYATWDTQMNGEDIGWLSYSTNHGVTWSPPQRVTPDHSNALHIMQIVGGQTGVAYIAWLSNNASEGYAQYLRPFSVTRGWLSQPIQVSASFGKKKVWPGDTIGVSVLPSKQGGGQAHILISWGSAIGDSSESQIFAAVVTY